MVCQHFLHIFQKLLSCLFSFLQVLSFLDDHHGEDQKKTLKALVKLREQFVVGAGRIERDLLRAARNAENNTGSIPHTQQELAEIHAEREKLTKMQRESQEHLLKVQEAEEKLSKATEDLEQERARIREVLKKSGLTISFTVIGTTRKSWSFKPAKEKMAPKLKANISS